MIEMKGKKYGRWLVLRRGKEKCKHGEKLKWLCRCICGKERLVDGYCLRSGGSKSCGCLSTEMLVTRNKKNIKHNMSGGKLYAVWLGMKQRCYYKKMRQYKYYGGRGIFVCDEWRHDFQAFHDWATQNKWNPSLQVDRIDNDKGYSPFNCRVVTAQVNAINRSTSRYWFIDGVEYNSAVQASCLLGVSITKIHRMCLGRRAGKNRKAKLPFEGCFSIKKYK